MAKQELDAQAHTEALLVEARRRSGRINRYVDMIPARFYLSSEALQNHKPRSSLDPAQYKRTSELLIEVLTAQADAASAGSSSQAKKKKAKKNGQARPSLEDEGPTSRSDLRNLLEERIAELKEQRRAKQSEADVQKREASAKPAQSAKPVSDKRPASPVVAPVASPAKRPRAESADTSVKEDDVEAGRLSFTPRGGELPYETMVNRRGTKARQLRDTLRKEEGRTRKLDSIENKEERIALQNKFALDKALKRARGEKVHDDVGRLRKTQKQLEISKAKSKEKWDSRVEANDQDSRARQDKRKANLKWKSDQKASKKAQRAGFEGKKTGFLNKSEE